MVRKRALVNGVSVKVENRSGFDKARFNALTTGVGSITPLVKQRVIPNSDGSCRVKISAQLPPLASDCFLRTHLKLEAFFCPDRLCYGGYESFFCGREIYDADKETWTRAKLPRLGLTEIPAGSDIEANFIDLTPDPDDAYKYISFEKIFAQRGPGSLMDYLGISNPDASYTNAFTPKSILGAGVRFSGLTEGEDVVTADSQMWFFNIFPFIMYQLIYDEYYRNKLVEKPLFSPPSGKPNIAGELTNTNLKLYNLPYVSVTDNIMTYVDLMQKGVITDYVSYGINALPDSGYLDGFGWTDLLNGNLLDLRQRNYGDDYFTCAMPNAQEGSPVTVQIADNQFSIAALRMSNALQEFAEINGYASPDYVQTLSARYGSSLSYGVAQKPVFLGSVDIPMYTSGVEQTSNNTYGEEMSQNPFNTVAARYGRAHAEGTEFVCKFHADEPGYFFVMATLVPEAQYFQGVDKDMMTFIDNGSLTDIPCGLLEHVGNEPIHAAEINSQATTPDGVFGYVQRYLWHKLGHQNEVHGLFKMSQSLGSFVVQREIGEDPQISTDFLKIKRSDLDNVSAVNDVISNYGVMIDSLIDLKVSEPLAESALPSLSNPAREHGRSVYVKTGGTKLS